MELRRKPWRIVCILFTAISTPTTFSATIQASVHPDPAPIGEDNPLIIRCIFNWEDGEIVQKVSLLDQSHQEDIANLFRSMETPLWTTGAVATDLKVRGYLSGSLNSRMMSMVLDDTRCSDHGVRYRYEMHYVKGNEGPVVTDETTVHVQVGPQDVPQDMVVFSPSSSSSELLNRMPGSQMTFRCSGNVGSPAGTFHWFIAHGDNYAKPGGRKNVTNKAIQGTPLSVEGCTFVRNSSLTLTLTRTEKGKPMRVLCLVSHPDLANPAERDCSNPNVDLCRESTAINVMCKAGDRSEFCKRREPDVRSSALRSETGFACLVFCLLLCFSMVTA